MQQIMYPHDNIIILRNSLAVSCETGEIQLLHLKMGKF